MALSFFELKVSAASPNGLYSDTSWRGQRVLCPVLPECIAEKQQKHYETAWGGERLNMFAWYMSLVVPSLRCVVFSYSIIISILILNFIIT